MFTGSLQLNRRAQKVIFPNHQRITGGLPLWIPIHQSTIGETLLRGNYYTAEDMSLEKPGAYGQENPDILAWSFPKGTIAPCSSNQRMYALHRPPLALSVCALPTRTRPFLARVMATLSLRQSSRKPTCACNTQDKV